MKRSAGLAPRGARYQLEPPHSRDAATAPVRLAFKLTLKRNVKIIAHGSVLRHNPDPTETWEGNTAYVARGADTHGIVAATDIIKGLPGGKGVRSFSFHVFGM